MFVQDNDLIKFTFGKFNNPPFFSFFNDLTSTGYALSFEVTLPNSYDERKIINSLGSFPRWT